MDITEFVKDTLVQIFEGVAQAQAAATKHGGLISPSAYAAAPKSNDGRMIQLIEFDVAVTTESSSGGGAKVAVWGIGAGIGGASKDSVVSRIKFAVPVALPGSREPERPSTGSTRALMEE